MLLAEASSPAGDQVFQQLGSLTRVLHDALDQLGVMPQLQHAAEGLPDARSRLGYIANKTAEAADNVLNLVDSAKAEQTEIAHLTRRLARQLADDPTHTVLTGAVLAFVDEIEARTSAVDSHLTSIMLAQDFHDLTGQVVGKVVQLAADLEDSLLRLLLQSAPESQKHKLAPMALAGPVVAPEGRTNVVADQGEVDDLLASLGF